MPIPTDAMASEAKKGLAWREEFGRGGTAVGVARARDIANKANLSDNTVNRMVSFFARHEVDKKAEGFSPGEKGFPSNGRIAWALWGGDPGKSWANKERKKQDSRDSENDMEARPYPNEHAARLREPDEFDKFRRENDAGGEGVDFIYGIANETSTIQSIRFDAEFFTSSEARTWLRENDYRPILFEEATGRHMESTEEVKQALEGCEFRSTKIERYENSEEQRVFDISIFSETPVERSYGFEILDVERADLSWINSGNAPLLLDHDPRQQIGVVESASIDSTKRKSLAKVRLGKSKLAEEIRQDIIDGIRRNISIGYTVSDMVKTEEELDGRAVYRVTPRVMEASIVSIPADVNVGTNRKFEVKESKMENKQEIDLEEVRQGYEQHVASQQMKKAQQSYEQKLASRQKEVAEIIKLAKKHNRYDLAEVAIGENKSLSDFRGTLLEEIGSKPLETEPLELTKKEQKQYSLIRAINALSNQRPQDAGFEMEVSQEIAKRTGREPRGFYAAENGWATRTITDGGSGGAGYGSYTIADNLMVDRFIDALISESILSNVGATIMTGLTGDVTIPKFASNAAVSWSTETGSVGNNEPDFGRVQMNPKHATNKISLSRQMLVQGLNGNIEQVIRRHMIRLFAAAVDNVALKGAGSNEPTGVLATSGIGDVSSGSTSGNAAIAYGDVLNIWSEIAADNALRDSMYWVTHPRVVGKLMSTLVESSTDSRMIMMNPNDLVGYPVVQTTQMPGSGDGTSTPYSLLFGNFSDLYVGYFGSSAPDILVDPYANAGTSVVNVYTYLMMDTVVGRPESFAAAQDVTV